MISLNRSITEDCTGIALFSMIQVTAVAIKDHEQIFVWSSKATTWHFGCHATSLGNATQEACKRNTSAITKSLLHMKSKKILTLAEQTYKLNYTSFINACFSKSPFILFKHLQPLGIYFPFLGRFKPSTGCLFSEFL